jgi:DNA-binding NarL/FixJ family response regulator
MANASSSPNAAPNPPAVLPAVPPSVVVILRCTLPPPLVDHLFKIGAAGYLPADALARQWIAPADAAPADAAPFPLAAPLSPLELDVVRLIGDGHATRTIAKTLHKSIKTIQTYRTRIKKKLGLASPTALAQWAWQFVHGVGKRAA